MRITSGGDLLVGATSIPGAGSSTTGACMTGSGAITAQRAAATVGFFGRSNDGELFAFYNNTTQVGNISVAASSTSYNTSSDYRLKQDLKDFNGLDLLTKIKTYDYEWKSDKTRSYGVIAHELQSVINYAVTGVKDGKEMQGVDYSKIVPVLIKAVQESHTIIKTLEERIINLEHK
jgi:predicted DNA binding CopG/RHH family protein